MLQRPDTPFRSLESFVLAAVNRALDLEAYVGDPRAEEILSAYREAAAKAFTSMASKTARYTTEAAMIPQPGRVSASKHIRCAGQAYFCAQGENADPIPMRSRLSLNIGSAVHADLLGGLFATCPQEAVAYTELRLDLPSWWPAGEWASSVGYLDFLYQLSPAMKDWFDCPMPDYLIVDLKTMASFGARKHATEDFTKSADPFGYVTQLSVYREMVAAWTGAPREAIACCLLGVSRDQPNKVIVPRMVPQDVLNLAAEKVQLRMKAAQEERFDAEFLVGCGKDAHFYCVGTPDRPPMCSFAKQCAEKRAQSGA